jgi:hypothetical protein
MVPFLRLPLAVALVGLVVVLVAAGCGKKDPSTTTAPPAADGLGFPTLATKNTTRVAGADPVADAAGVAGAVFPADTATARPPAVVLADAGRWEGAIAASVLMARPVRAPLLLADGGELPEATTAALKRLQPPGSGVLGRAQVIRIGDVPEPQGLRSTPVRGGDAFALAAAIDRVATSAAGKPSDTVVVVGADDPAYAMPAAAWAAKSGDPVLFVQRDRLPGATAAALRRHDRPRIFVLGGPKQVSEQVLTQLGALGAVRRVDAGDPQRTAVAFARFSDGGFGWAVREPGHGVVFANPTQPVAAAAAAPLSAAGSYGPLLLTDDGGELPDPVVQFLLDIQPGYRSDPVRGVYNHGWLVGDERAITVATQSRIDALLEITQVSEQPSS